MQAAACPGEQACGKDLLGEDCQPVHDPAAAQPIGTPDIPVRRYGTVPPPPEDQRVWEIESAPARTIAEHGGVVVLAAAVVAAALGAWLLYLL